MYTPDDFARLYEDYPCTQFQEKWDWIRNTHSEESYEITQNERDQLQVAQANDQQCLTIRNEKLMGMFISNLQERQTDNLYEVAQAIQSGLLDTQISLDNALSELGIELESLGGTIDEIPGAIRTELDESIGGLDDVLRDFRDTYEIKQNAIKNTIELLSEIISGSIDNGLNKLDDTLNDTSSLMREIQQGLSNNVAEGFLGIYQALKDNVSGAIYDVKDVLFDTYEGMKDGIIKQIDAAKDNFNNLKKGIQDKIELIDKTVDIGFELLTTGITGLIPGLFKGFNDMLTFDENELLTKVAEFKGFFTKLAEVMIND